MLQDAKQLDTRSLAETHDFEIACDPKLSAPDALSIVSRTLTLLGVRTKYHDDSVVAVSGRWTVWGSPVFHWALLGLLLSLLVGNMLRSEGLMGVIVGQTAADVPESYGVLHTGPLHDWGGVHRSIRVDGFELGYTTGGVDRGPTPTVSLLDGSGAVVQTQRVYPNMTLKNGSLTIYPSSYGLAVLASEVDSSGAVVGSGHQLADFSEQAAGGTVAAGSIALLSASGATVYSAALTVPLDQRDGAWLDRIPDNPSARVLVTSRDGATVLDHVVRVGETLAVPGSLSLRLDGIVYYARLQVVDDWTIPLLYAGLFVALVGLSIATLARQQIVLVTAVKGPSGVRIVAKVRLWRNSSSSRREIESELGQALGEPENRSTL
jgi:cytochrome c biogenesis protein ResB